jgi:hypothetical protein
MFGRTMFFLLSLGLVGTLGLSYSRIESNPQFVSEGVVTAQVDTSTPEPVASIPVPQATPSPTPEVKTTPTPVAASPEVKEVPKAEVAKPTPAPVPIPVVKPANPKHQKGANDCTNKPQGNISYDQYKVLMDSFNANPSNPNICNFVQIKQAIGNELFMKYYQQYRTEGTAKKSD